MASTTPDTPDYQQGVVNAQKLLASPAGGTSSVIVGVPPNCQSLLVLLDPSDTLSVPGVAGEVSGYTYPTYPVPLRSTVGPWRMYVATVSPAIDDQVTVGFGTAPANPWYVVADAGVRGVLDASTAASTANTGAPLPDSGLLILGSDGTDALAVAVDTGGRLVVAPPDRTSSLIQVNANPTTIIDTPSSGALYLQGADIMPASGTALGALQLLAGTDTIAFAGVAAGGSGQAIFVNLGGYRTASAVSAQYTNNSGGFVVVRYRVGD